MKTIEEIARPVRRPIKVVQFGEGNFLRAFADLMIDQANAQGLFQGNIAVVKPIAQGSLETFYKQGNLYTVCLRGKQNGVVVTENHVVSSIAEALESTGQFERVLELARTPSVEFVISNTTEAGIVYEEESRFDDCPPLSYPAKLTRFLYERFRAFDGEAERGMVILPVELIEANGKILLDCVLRTAARWELGKTFARWLTEDCVFCSTLVDRIVTGYPKQDAADYEEALGYHDALLDVAEPFGLWVIESPRSIAERFPLDRAGQPVLFTQDQTPYRERKVRILNGAHTSTVLAGYLMGKNTVGECMDDPLIRTFMERAVLMEIVPTVPLPRQEAEAFAQAVFERFENPFVHHALLSISLNSVSKWKARVLPSLRDYYRETKNLPRLLTFSFAALLAFDMVEQIDENGHGSAQRGTEPYAVCDDRAVVDFFAAHSRLSVKQFVEETASQTAFWGEDLREIPQFVETVVRDLTTIRTQSMRAAMEAVLAEQEAADA